MRRAAAVIAKCALAASMIGGWAGAASAQLLPPPAVAPAAVAAAPVFPALPPSRPCNGGDLPGVWQLMQVTEVPSGSEAAFFATSPMQYLIFSRDNLFLKRDAGRIAVPPRRLRKEMRDQSAIVLRQYLLQNTGVLYLYENSTPVDLQICFIVVNHLGNFMQGQMLLMPPEGQSTTRLVKAYQKMFIPPQQRGGIRR